jgi:two-component system, NarL family, response regulator NreC
MSAIRVMLVDDHAVFRAGLRLLIGNEPEMRVTAEAESCPAARERQQRDVADVLVLDLTMPGGGSLSLIQDFLGQGIVSRVLVLTMHDEPAYVRAALAAGATGYVVKTVSEIELIDAIRSVHSGKIFLDLDDPQKTSAVFSQLLGRSGEADVTPLSDREQQVLELLGRGFTNQAVAEQLELSPKTVATYRARIAEKLGLKSTVDFVKFAADVGKGNRLTGSE